MLLSLKLVNNNKMFCLGGTTEQSFSTWKVISCLSVCHLLTLYKSEQTVISINPSTDCLSQLSDWNVRLKKQGPKFTVLF